VARSLNVAVTQQNMNKFTRVNFAILSHFNVPNMASFYVK